MSEAEAFVAGAKFVLENLHGPRVQRPDHITDKQWVDWYGAKPLPNGSFASPMSVAHLFPKGRWV